MTKLIFIDNGNARFELSMLLQSGDTFSEVLDRSQKASSQNEADSRTEPQQNDGKRAKPP